MRSDRGRQRSGRRVGREQRQRLGVDVAPGHGGQAGVGRHLRVQVAVARHRVRLTPRLRQRHARQHEGHRVLASDHGVALGPDDGVVGDSPDLRPVSIVSKSPTPGDDGAECQDLNINTTF